MRGILERELKLRAPEGFELPALAGEPLEPRVFVATYHDTTDFRLARVGVTLRHRVENGRGAWQLKLPRGEGRMELESDGGPVEVPGELAALLPAITRGHELVAAASLRTRRSGVRVRDPGSAAEVVLDRVSMLDGRRVTRAWEEVEVELVEGDPAILGALRKQLRAAGARDDEDRPKLVQALGLRLDAEDGEAPDDAIGALRAMLREQAGRLLAHDPGVRIGDDPEDVHQLRVAARRSRAFLRATRPLLVREWEEALQDELRWLLGVLGPVRDHDVLLEYLQAEADGLDGRDREAFVVVFDRIEHERLGARDTLLRALESDRYLALLDRLEEAAERPHALDDDRTLAQLWRREWRRLRRAVGELGPAPADEELHAARIRAKRARYAAELAAPALGRRGSRFVSRAKELQDVLGEHQDAAVAEERLRALAHDAGSPATAVAAGRLVERQRARRAAARTGLDDVWERLERAGKRVTARSSS
jgi:CHAD domain-containing protein